MADDDGTVERATLFGEVAAGGHLTVDNPFGDLRLRHGGVAGKVEVAAVLQHLRPDGIRLEVRLVEVDGGLTVTVGWPSKPDWTPPPPPPGDRSRVDLAVMVPAGVVLSASTGGGLIETRGMHCDATFRTDSGAVTVNKHDGAVSATSDQGKITAVLLAGVTEAAQAFTTVTGDIEVWIKPAAVHRARLATSGAITTDFSIDIENRGAEEPDKVGLALVGGGGPELSLTSRRGDLALRRLAELHSSAAQD